MLKIIKELKERMNQQDPFHVKLKQHFNLWFALIIGVFFGWVILHLVLPDSRSVAEAKNKTEFASPRKSEIDKSLFILKTQNQLKELNHHIKGFGAKINKLIKHDNMLSNRQDEESKKVDGALSKLVQFKNEIEEKFIKAVKKNKQIPLSNLVGNHSKDLGYPNFEKEKGIRNDEIQLIVDHIDANKNTNSYVPVGTFVQAVLLSGLSAGTSVTGQANPRPVLMRILNGGNLPNHFHSHLAGCHLTGAGVGDISSERAYIRLEHLSCVKEDHSIIEFPVYGTVIGPDGRDGIHGRAVWGNKKLLRNSFTSGLLSGIGQGFSQRYLTSSVSPLGVTQTINNSAILQHGLTQGVSNASAKLADYYLKQADQYQPVIEISAGTIVDIVFLKHGFKLNQIVNIRDK